MRDTLVIPEAIFGRYTLFRDRYLMHLGVYEWVFEETLSDRDALALRDLGFSVEKRDAENYVGCLSCHDYDRWNEGQGYYEFTRLTLPNAE